AKLGHVVAGMATSGEQALRMIEDVFPDIVLMDIHIQGEMDGIETARRIPRDHQNGAGAEPRRRGREGERSAALSRAMYYAHSGMLGAAGNTGTSRRRSISLPKNKRRLTRLSKPVTGSAAGA